MLHKKIIPTREAKDARLTVVFYSNYILLTYHSTSSFRQAFRHVTTAAILDALEAKKFQILSYCWKIKPLHCKIRLQK